MRHRPSWSANGCSRPDHGRSRGIAAHSRIARSREHPRPCAAQYRCNLSRSTNREYRGETRSFWLCLGRLHSRSVSGRGMSTERSTLVLGRKNPMPIVYASGSRPDSGRTADRRSPRSYPQRRNGTRGLKVCFFVRALRGGNSPRGQLRHRVTAPSFKRRKSCM